MKHINEFLVNKRIDKKIDQPKYEYFPKDENELYNVMKKLVKERISDFTIIDTSKIKTLGYIFYDLYNEMKGKYIEVFKNIDASYWNTSKVTSIEGMCSCCEHMNIDVTGWDVSNVENMSYAFNRCEDFTGVGLVDWNTSNVKFAKYTFNMCQNLKEDLGNWNVSKIEDARNMFSNCYDVELDLSKWDLNRCDNMKDMLFLCNNVKSLPKGFKHY
ncbi:MAG: BspA family leucine-rich repeat surface protein [Clostridia bacterium]|nr:BspA family leucine-rich repeat surface protein [Clostridia bacterium]